MSFSPHFAEFEAKKTFVGELSCHSPLFAEFEAIGLGLNATLQVCILSDFWMKPRNGIESYATKKKSFIMFNM